MKKEDGHPDELSLKLFVILSRAYRSISDFVTDDMKRYGLNPSEFMVLELLYHKGEQPIQHIGKKVLLASGSMTYVIDKLVSKQLLERKSSQEDRRVIYASITKAGKQLMDEIFPQHRAAIEKLFKGLTAEQKDTMIQLLKETGLKAANLKK
ncbi:MarR family transcriptional regulator [Brevibacillus nitrificans]|uniref:MarR family winged helix-turn-helix transcriptional regulator n=1 Tax=Brevibacillus nitrificans TaxID=651560 RepID=UPI0028653107|nr:MarR family transcriptional regulator [Brevibacillus nitrificans]MDR7319234.1 MarR family 2-MHQ and catechol resistance regulon transcriptional repressor [Brevibacillus nitrificans]